MSNLGKAKEALANAEAKTFAVDPAMFDEASYEVRVETDEAVESGVLSAIQKMAEMKYMEEKKRAEAEARKGQAHTVLPPVTLKVKSRESQTHQFLGGRFSVSNTSDYKMKIEVNITFE